MVRTTWIYSLRKEELTALLEEFGHETIGTVEELRKRLASFAFDLHPGLPAHARLTELEGKYTRALVPSSRAPSPTNLTVPERCHDTTLLESKSTLRHHDSAPDENQYMPHGTRPAEVETGDQHLPSSTLSTVLQIPKKNPARMDMENIIDKIRKWQVSFNGLTGPLTFIERLEEFAHVYDISLDTLPRAMPKLLRDRALSKYRSNNRRWTTWGALKRDLLQFFLPVRYLEQLEDHIHQRTQQPQEAFNDYVLALKKLMRHAPYDSSQQLERIYRNARQEYQLHIKRREFSTLDEFLLLAGDYEAIRGKVTTEETPTDAEVAELRLDVRTACRRCGSNGHIAPQSLKYLDFDERHIFLELVIGTNAVHATIDTGATCSFISSELAQQLENVTRTQHYSLIVRMADGTERHLTEKLEIPLQIGQQAFRQPALVLPHATDDLVLGMDFLMKVGATFSCGNKSIKLRFLNNESNNNGSSSSDSSSVSSSNNQNSDRKETSSRRAVTFTRKLEKGNDITLPGDIIITNTIVDPWSVSRATMARIMAEARKARRVQAEKSRRRIRFRKTVEGERLCFRLGAKTMVVARIGPST